MSIIMSVGPISSVSSSVHPLAGMTGMREIWRADSGITMDGSNLISEWKGMLRAEQMVQATPAAKPTWTATNANLNNKPAVLISDATKKLVTNLPKTAYNWRHNGTLGVTEVAVYYSAATDVFQYLVTTGNTAAPGFTLSAFNTTPFAFTSNDSTFSQALANGTYAAGKHWLAGTGSQGGTVITRCRTDKSSSWVSTGAFAPSSNDSFQNFSFNGAASTPISLAEVIQLTGVISDPDFTTLTAYLVSQYGAF